MNDPLDHPVMTRVRNALGRAAPLASPPTPPEIDEHVVRLVFSNVGLPELFAKRAADMKMLVEMVKVDDLLSRLTAFLREQASAAGAFTGGIDPAGNSPDLKNESDSREGSAGEGTGGTVGGTLRPYRVMLSDTPVISRLNVACHLRDEGFDARQWSEMSADDAYDFNCGVTDVDYAVAETGTVVIRHRPEHGRLLSLVPFVHVAIVEPKCMVPDLIDLFAVLKRDGTGSGVTLISGPSKTADIEMNTVIGVHGPNIVKAFVLS